MDRVRHVIVGAGTSGLAYADRLGLDEDYLVLEADSEIGGYCKTIVQDGFRDVEAGVVIDLCSPIATSRHGTT